VTLVLTVTRSAWETHVSAVAADVDGLVPVVKGNGYGFGRDWLARRAAELAGHIAVGSVHEVSSVPTDRVPVVLTPLVAPAPNLRPDAVLTVGSPAHLSASAGHGVLLKIRSSMNRYGCAPHEAVELASAARRAGCTIIGVSIHPPLAGSDADHVREVADIVRALPADLHDLAVWVSHVSARGLSELRAELGDREWFARLGTSLWHGDKSMFRLTADVIDTRPVRRGDRAGYRLVPVESDGLLVDIGCGSAHGVAPLTDGLSPFHFARRRLALVEPPHMHTSMVIIADEHDRPNVGDHVDVQRPLISTAVDRIDWI